MKLRKVFALVLAMTLVFSLTVGASATVWEDVDDFAKLAAAFGDTDAEVQINLTNDIVNEYGDTLWANAGQTYTIDGQGYTLMDVHLAGEGEVVINADIVGSEYDDALNTYEEVTVTVNGDIEAKEDAVDANEQSTVVVNGDVSSTGQDAIDADDQAEVTVNGDVRGGVGADGVDADDQAKVTVNGDVYGGSGTAPDADGNLEYGNMSDPDGYSDGGAGVEADGNAQVTVDGDVYGGDSYGTYSYAGAGIEAGEEATVTVTGNVTGGDQIADPEVPASGIDEYGNPYRYIGYAGDGILMANTADVTVGGDVTGGEASGQESVGGSGVYIEVSLNADVYTDPGTGETVADPIEPGQVTVGGTVAAAESTAENGTDGAAVYYAIYDMNPVEDSTIPEEYIENIVASGAPAYLRMCVTNAMPGVIGEAGMYYVELADRQAYQEDYALAVIELAEEYGAQPQGALDLAQIVASVPEENLAEFVEAAMHLGNDIILEMAKTVYAVPVLTAGALEAVDDGALVGSFTDEQAEYFGNNYIVLTGLDEDESIKTEGNTEIQKQPAPKTGDTNNIVLLSTFLVASAVALCTCAVMRTKKYSIR